MMFKEKNITKSSNLETNDSLSCYLGHTAQQNPHAYRAFYNLLREVKPSRILEIGTGMGGFTMFLKLTCSELGIDTDILTYDIHSNQGYQALEALGINVKIENIFNNRYSETKQEVVEYIQKDGTTVVLCDGGSKVGEFNMLAKFLKVGDIIMAHDYATNSEYFNSNIYMKFWNWLEIQDSDIDLCVKKYNLNSYMQDEFTPAVWVCKIRTINE